MVQVRVASHELDDILKSGPRTWEPGWWDWYVAQRKSSQTSVSTSTPVPAPASGSEVSLQYDGSLGPVPFSRKVDEGIFTGLDPLCLTLVMSLLPPRDLARCKGVCRAWREVAAQPDVRRASFMAHWGLAGLTGEPRSPAFLEAASVSGGSFALRHTLAKGDTLPALAVRHAVPLPELKRLNGLTTDRALHSRTHVYVPLRDACALRGRRVALTFCDMACREFAVVLPPEGAEGEGDAVAAQAPATELSPTQAEAARAKMARLLARSLRTDEHSARFYLEAAGGDVRAALAAAEEDARWAGGSKGRAHTQHAPPTAGAAAAAARSSSSTGTRVGPSSSGGSTSTAGGSAARATSGTSSTTTSSSHRGSTQQARPGSRGAPSGAGSSGGSGSTRAPAASTDGGGNAPLVVGSALPGAAAGRPARG